MVEKWAFLQIIKIVIPLALLVIAIILLASSIVVHCLLEARKFRYLKARGFERYLSGVPSAGGGAYYGWKNDATGSRIEESEIRRINFKELKRRLGDD